MPRLAVNMHEWPVSAADASSDTEGPTVARDPKTVISGKDAAGGLLGTAGCVSGGCENLGFRGHGPPQRRAGEQPGRVKRRQRQADGRFGSTPSTRARRLAENGARPSLLYAPAEVP